MASQITSNSSACLTACTGWLQHDSSKLCITGFGEGIHWWPVNFTHKGSMTHWTCPCHDVSMLPYIHQNLKIILMPILSSLVTMEVSIMTNAAQIARFMAPTWAPPGSCRPQTGPMLVPWTLLSGWHRQWRKIWHYDDSQITFLL